MYQYVSSCLYAMLAVICMIRYAVHKCSAQVLWSCASSTNRLPGELEEVRTRRVVTHVRRVLPYYGRLHALCPPPHRVYVLVDHACLRFQV